MEKAEPIHVQPNSVAIMGPAASCSFSGCIIPAMAPSGQGSESWNSQFLVDSMPVTIHAARPDDYLDYLSKRWLEYLGVITYDVSRWAFVHREVEGILAKRRACLATGEKFGYKTRVCAEDGEYRRKLHCKVPLRDGCGNNFPLEDLVDRFRVNDRTRAVTDCDPARALKFDSLWAIGRNAQCAWTRSFSGIALSECSAGSHQR